MGTLRGTLRGLVCCPTRLLKEKAGASAMVRFERALMLAKALGDRGQERRATRGLAAGARLQARMRAAPPPCCSSLLPAPCCHEPLSLPFWGPCQHPLAHRGAPASMRLHCMHAT
jgi:hypothetical protein